MRQRYGLGDDPVILYTGVLDEFQRLDLLLAAMKEVVWYEPCQAPDCRHHTSCGPPGPDPGQADELGVGANVLLTGPQPLPAIRDFLAAGDVAVVPRPNAPGFPIKLLNYLAAGNRACCSPVRPPRGWCMAGMSCWPLPTPAWPWGKESSSCARPRPGPGTGPAGLSPRPRAPRSVCHCATGVYSLRQDAGQQGEASNFPAWPRCVRGPARNACLAHSLTHGPIGKGSLSFVGWVQ